MFTHFDLFHVIINLFWLYFGGKIFISYIDSSNLLPTYNNLQHEQPYNTRYPVPINNVVVGSGKITLNTGRKIMRSYYQNTIYDMSTKLSGGAFGTPDRWRGGEGEDEVTGHWERNIGISRSIIFSNNVLSIFTLHITIIQYPRLINKHYRNTITYWVSQL